MKLLRLIRTAFGNSESFSVKVGVHQGSVLSPLLFVIVMEAVTKNIREGLPWELLYADDSVLMATTEEELVRKIKIWKGGLEKKGKISKTKVMVSNCDDTCEPEKKGNWLCGVCGKGVGSNSLQCVIRKKWNHHRCTGIKECVT